MSVILEGRGLRKAFGGLVAVDDVDLSIERGAFHSVIGPNGAGKTTLFNLLSGTLAPTSGRVIVKGEDITHLPSHKSISKGLGRSFQITNVFPNLTVFENIRLAAQAPRGESRKFLAGAYEQEGSVQRTAEVIEEVDLEKSAFQPARTLPHGDQRKLELGMILAPDPEILLLDEPTAGMASDQVPELMALISRIREAGGKTVVLVEHNMRVVMSASDRVTVMHQGAVLAEGTPEEIAGNEEVQIAYLGSLEFGAGR